jgi:hypothetical protein
MLLPAFQVQVLKWTGDSGSNPELASLRYIPLVVKGKQQLCVRVVKAFKSLSLGRTSTVKLVGILQFSVSG